MKTKTFKVGDLILAKDKTSELSYLVEFKGYNADNDGILGNYKALTYSNGEEVPFKYQERFSNVIGYFGFKDYTLQLE